MKAVLVIDMPKKCEDCPIEQFLRLRDITTYVCGFRENGTPKYTNIYRRSERPDWCPLKPLPKPPQGRELIKAAETSPADYFSGWNDCLEKIMGGELE